LPCTLRIVPFPPAARLLLVVIALVAVCALARPTTADAGVTRSEARLLKVVNQARANHGLRKLRVGSALQEGAHNWARYLRIHDSFYHGRLATGTSENIGWLTCRDNWAGVLVRWWLRSPSHRPHLLDRSARRIGVGVGRGEWSGYNCVWVGVTRFG
jgi:uncharacterized protein YkwD